jgi:UDP-3-O-[3-hydroxymyristoyl] glucosamine N-acyltransferase
VLVSLSGVAGSAALEDHVLMGAQAGVAGHITIGKGAQIAGRAAVIRDVEPGVAVAGVPAMPIKDFFRLCAIWRRQVKTRGKGNE